VIQGVAEGVVLGEDEGRDDTHVELKPTGEQDAVFGAHVLGQGGFDAAVELEVTADEARRASARRDGGEFGERGMIGKAEVVVAAQADDVASFVAIGGATPVADSGRRAGEVAAFEGCELGRESLVVGRGHEGEE
jgi:hypothetical protein